MIGPTLHSADEPGRREGAHVTKRSFPRSELPAAGTMHGRDQVRAWIQQTMTTFPGSHMVAFPSLWSVIDAPTGRIICELDNPMADPGDGSVITATNISIVTYAGDGLWCRQEDIYNPLRFLRAGMKWCRKAQALGTLDEDAARWMQENGGGSK